ncbi:MAG TPA: mechanosensitive ion channel domain-containing protein [Prolixibacteraceae bacterium]|nr:mechanosensitive ion channel domain-containing protein [Prolixibacteraceae bacterium]
MDQYFSNETVNLVIASASFIVLLVIIFFIYRYLFHFLKKKVSLTVSKIDDFVLNLFKIPSLWVIYWVLLKIFTHIFLSSLTFYPYLLHVNSLLLIFSLTWILIQLVKVVGYYLQGKFDIGVSDNLRARKYLTQINVFQGIANSIIITIAIAIGLMTFEQARTIGLSLLTSAGIIGIIVGFAAQKSLGLILAGIQIAITQPIRFDDVVIVEGEWGRIEEITLTYVVVKIWDERRLVLPVTYFLEKPFQNWTRSSADIIGTIFLYVDYDFPVESIRKVLPEMLKREPDWDKRVVNVQVTKATEQYKEIRVLLSSSDASRNWDLRTAIREKLIDFINENYPDTFAKIRIKTN